MVQDIQRERAARLDLDALWLKDQMKDCYVAAREKGDLKSAARLLESLGKLISRDQGHLVPARIAATPRSMSRKGKSYRNVHRAEPDYDSVDSAQIVSL